jgi:hypothetical protein
MPLVKPLVLGSNGRITQIQPGDTLNAPVSEVDSYSLTNASASAALICTPVCISGADAFVLARADAVGTADAFALVSAASIAAAGSGSVQTDGFFIATTAQWDAITGQTGGLTPNAAYFLSATTAGRLTTTAPTATGQFSTYIGRAVSATVLELSIDRGILL